MKGKKVALAKTKNATLECEDWIHGKEVQNKEREKTARVVEVEGGGGAVKRPCRKKRASMEARSTEKQKPGSTSNKGRRK